MNRHPYSQPVNKVFITRDELYGGKDTTPINKMIPSRGNQPQQPTSQPPQQPHPNNNQIKPCNEDTSQIDNESPIDMNALLEALDSETNDTIAKLNSRMIFKKKDDMLRLLPISEDKILEYHNDLREYRLIESYDELEFGRNIRWISLHPTSPLKLTKGATIVSFTVKEENSIEILCTLCYKFWYKIQLDKVMIFQKLTKYEKLILQAIDFLDDSKSTVTHDDIHPDDIHPDEIQDETDTQVDDVSSEYTDDHTDDTDEYSDDDTAYTN